ncbi:MAG: hypothetical protein FJZ64_03940, partial [Chlamydiae bacterium]|nr:hypothetical protein [Chlamydiota bacterium]
MDKHRKWQFLLILTVIALTIYNILPTVFYYLKPLKTQVSVSKANQIAEQIEQRVLSLETDAKDWLASYCELLQIKPRSIAIDSENPEFFLLLFSRIEEAERFKAYLPRAGSLIPFIPAQLSLALQDGQDKEVRVQRKISLPLQKEDFFYAAKNDPKILKDRLERIAIAIEGQSESNFILSGFEKEFPPSVLEEFLSQINAISEAVPTNSALEDRFFTHLAHRKEAAQLLIEAFTKEKQVLLEAKKEAAENLKFFEKREKSLVQAIDFLKTRLTKLQSHFPWTAATIQKALETQTRLNFGNLHPLFSELFVDFEKDQIILTFHQDVIDLRKNHHERFEQLFLNEIAAIRRLTEEELLPSTQIDDIAISIPLHSLTKPTGYLVLDQVSFAKKQIAHLKTTLHSLWRPTHPDLQNLPIVDYETYKSLPSDQKALCLVIGSPLLFSSEQGSLHPHSLYVAVKGIDKILKTYEAHPNSKEAIEFTTDFRKLADLLHRESFFGSPASLLSFPLATNGDFLFEKPHFAKTLFAATREDFREFGTGKFAYIELGD